MENKYFKFMTHVFFHVLEQQVDFEEYAMETFTFQNT
jgi:hypothetical protein